MAARSDHVADSDTGRSDQYDVVKNLTEQFGSGIQITDDDDDKTDNEDEFHSDSLDRKKIGSRSKHGFVDHHCRITAEDIKSAHLQRSASADSPKTRSKVRSKIELGDASDWGHSPKKYFRKTTPWEVFGATLKGCETPTLLSKHKP
jgi:phage-related protein